MPSDQIIKEALHYMNDDRPYTDATVMKTGSGLTMATTDLRNAGLINEVKVSDGSMFSASPGLKLYVDALKAVPLPKQEWTIPRPVATR